MNNDKNLQVIVGLGTTGLSCARYLIDQGFQVAITDTRQNPPQLELIKKKYPTIKLSLGRLDETLLNQAARLIVSPGISIHEKAIAQQLARGIPVIGDIELFAKAVNHPVIAITGTNAKSTVTTLVGQMMKNAGVNVGVGGNLGTAALDLLLPPEKEAFVLELSSFQLETTNSLKPMVGTILNITPDHMDRYATLEEYQAAKQRVYNHCQIAVCNRDDPRTECHEAAVERKLYFTLNEPQKNEFGLRVEKNDTYLAFEDQNLMLVSELPILGKHYQANALSALAIGYGYGLSMAPMLKTLREFKGLAHRCELVKEALGVRWYNDSKGTNVGATIAAIEGLGAVIHGKIVLIAGGVGKNADFGTLVPAIEKFVKSAVLIGESASILADVFGDRVEVKLAANMNEAVLLSHQLAETGDCVLLSPACASFDMFNNFEHRGEVFAAAVRAL